MMVAGDEAGAAVVRPKERISPERRVRVFMVDLVRCWQKEWILWKEKFKEC